jgi:hypothetical protein
VLELELRIARNGHGSLEAHALRARDEPTSVAHLERELGEWVSGTRRIGDLDAQKLVLDIDLTARMS